MNHFLTKIEEATSLESENLVGFKSELEYIKALNHVKELIISSYELLKIGYYSQSLFLTITAIEEIAKVEVCICRGYLSNEIVKRSKDPLFSHNEKHSMAANPVILIGDRIENSIGKERANEIFQDLQKGRYGKIREKCLYFQRNKDCLIVPNESVNEINSHELLLISIEMVDDKFWGLNQSSTQISDELNIYYLKIDKSLKNIKNTTYNNMHKS